MTSVKGSSSSSPPIIVNFSFAFLGATIATSICHPFDVARVRAMVTGNNSGWFTEMITLFKKDGPKSLWVGLSAGLLRQAFYGTTRFGAFESLQDIRKRQKQQLQEQNNLLLTPFEKAICGILAGGLAGFVGNPADVALTRMTSDLKLPIEHRRGYKNGFIAMIRIGREDGLIKGLLCGVTANVQRSILVNMVMLGTYSQGKEMIQEKTKLPTNSPLLQFLAGNISGLMTALIAVPADFLKTKLQHAKVGQYSGTIDLMKKTWMERGILGFWAGFTPFWFKLAPHTTISFMVIEKCREIWMT